MGKTSGVQTSRASKPPPGRAGSGNGTSERGSSTRNKIIDAALQTVREQGLVGTSARAIARTGDFNQALVFYHFGSIEELLLAALERANDRRIEQFRNRLVSVDSPEELVEIARELHDHDRCTEHVAVVAIVAGWPANSEVGRRVTDILRPWDEMVETALRRILGGTAMAQLLPVQDLAHAMSCLFLGIEMIANLDPDDPRGSSLFATLLTAARLAAPVVDSMRDGNEALSAASRPT
jgi:AcrR family transcriptional regulator